MANVNDELMNSHVSDDLSELKQMFSNYQNKKTKTNTAANRENILAKYFVPRNNKEVFRILPPKPGRQRIEEAFFHVIPTLGSGGKVKHGTVLYCPAHNDPKVPKLKADGTPELDAGGKPIMVPAPCPVCDKHRKLLAKQNPSLKGIKKENMNSTQLEIKKKNDEIFKEASKWQAKKFYIIRGIDRGVEKDGVKFWRFKHNYRNQGTLDKLLPILEEFVMVNKADFTDVNNGTDISIIMTDSEFAGRTYKAISAMTPRGKSPLHNDPIVARQWLDDDITWRDVFKPKKAPGITSYEFLEMAANGSNPYWDESDPSKKRWVFPGRPDLEEAANTRTQTFDNDNTYDIEMASDVSDNSNIRITNVTKSDVGVYTDDAVDMARTATAETSTSQSTDDDQNYDDVDSDYEDLPF